MRVALRGATQADFDFVRQTKWDGLRPYIEPLLGWDAPWQTQRFAEIWDPAHTRIVVVDDADVGALIVFPYDDWVYLAGLYLVADHRGRGIGAEVLRRALAEAGTLPVRLRVLVNNPARSLYLRHGFVEVERTEHKITLAHRP